MRAERWTSEAAYFDRLAERLRASLKPIDPATLARYSGGLRDIYNKEFRLKLLGNLQGRRVLDLGCGEGTNAVLLARLGARVVGIDISPKSIELARARAEVNGVADRCEFVCDTLEATTLKFQDFDIIWGDGILHHVIDELEPILQRIRRWARPGALVVFSEPANLFPPLRALRLMLPIQVNGTPDERPLEKKEFELIDRLLPGLSRKSYGLLGRLSRWVLPGHNYEKASARRRRLADFLNRADGVLFRVPGMPAFASMVVLYGRLPERGELSAVD